MLHVTSGLHAYRWSAYKVSNGCFKSIKNGMHNGVGHFGSEHIGNLFRCSPPILLYLKNIGVFHLTIQRAY